MPNAKCYCRAFCIITISQVVRELMPMLTDFSVVMSISVSPQPAIPESGNHLGLSTSGMAINQRFAVVGLRNRQAWSTVLMRWAFSYPVTTNPVAAKGMGEFGGGQHFLFPM